MRPIQSQTPTISAETPRDSLPSFRHSPQSPQSPPLSYSAHSPSQKPVTTEIITVKSTSVKKSKKKSFIEVKNFIVIGNQLKNTTSPEFRLYKILERAICFRNSAQFWNNFAVEKKLSDTEVLMMVLPELHTNKAGQNTEKALMSGEVPSGINTLLNHFMLFNEASGKKILASFDPKIQNKVQEVKSSTGPQETTIDHLFFDLRRIARESLADHTPQKPHWYSLWCCGCCRNDELTRFYSAIISSLDKKTNQTEFKISSNTVKKLHKKLKKISSELISKEKDLLKFT